MHPALFIFLKIAWLVGVRFTFFLRLNHSPLYIYTTFSLFIQLSVDVWVASISNDKMSVNLWGSDYDGYTDYFFARDIAYYLTIPAGSILTGRATNEEDIVITYYGAETFVGIDQVNAQGATEVARYNLNGQRVAAGQTGVVIVKMSDGSSMKMIVR